MREKLAKAPKGRNQSPPPKHPNHERHHPRQQSAEDSASPLLSSANDALRAARHRINMKNSRVGGSGLDHSDDVHHTNNPPTPRTSSKKSVRVQLPFNTITTPRSRNYIPSSSMMMDTDTNTTPSPSNAALHHRHQQHYGNNHHLSSNHSDDASTLSNDSISESSTASLDHNVRLSNLRGDTTSSSKMSNSSNSNSNSNSNSKQDNSNDRDMTEDEVAIMVKNALRKARRAMNNSSPASEDDDDTSGGGGMGGGMGGGRMGRTSPGTPKRQGGGGMIGNSSSNNNRGDDIDDNDDDSSNEGHAKFRDVLETLPPTASDSDDMDLDSAGGGGNVVDTITASTTSPAKGGGGGMGDSLAKRIEEEIQSARAAAGRKYYSASPGKDEKSTTRASSSASPSAMPKGSSSTKVLESSSSPTPLSRSHGSNRSTITVMTANTEDTPLMSNISQVNTPVSEFLMSKHQGRNSPTSRSNKMAALLANANNAMSSGRSSPNQSSSPSSRTPRETARERMARSKDKIAAANEKLLNKDFKIKTRTSPSYSASGGGGSGGDSGSIASRPGSNNNRPSKISTSMSPVSKGATPSSTGKSSSGGMSYAGGFDSMSGGATSPTNVPSTVVARSPANNAPISPGSRSSRSSNSNNNASMDSSMTSPDKKKGGMMGTNDDPTMEEEEKEEETEQHNPNIINEHPFSPSNAFTPVNGSVLNINNSSGNSINSNRPPLSSNTSTASAPLPPPPPNTNSNKPQQHRQVLFRHPYPLPPPPPLPRADNIIIDSHSPPEKNINTRWVSPDVDLAALIEAAGEEYNLVRRSNACGALKVLASKDGNKPKLCRTQGLLDVLVKASWDDAVDSDALDARTRAVTTILYLSEPKDNRLIVAKHPQLLNVLVKVIQEDTGEARWRATSALATLGKTPGNRGGMGRVDNLATVLGDLMVVGQTRKDMDPPGKEGEKKNDDSRKMGTESREDDNSCLEGGESMTRGTKSYDTLDDERMLTHTYTGTFTDGTRSTFSEDLTYQSAYDSDTHSDMDGDEGDGTDNEDGSDGEGSDGEDYGSDEDDGSLQEEEGVEMQISSLKKLNIENASDFLAKSQLSACATLTHLSKHCANSPVLCSNDELLQNIIYLAGIFDSPLHTRCIEMLCNFTRFPSNNALLANMPRAIDTLLLCGKSKIGEDRMWSIRTIQNLCSDASSKVGLATGAILSLLSTAAMRKDYEEQFAAVGALMNLSTEPGSIVPLTNTKTVVATLVHLAHSPNTPSAVRKIACDSLATIGLWLQTLASAGTVPEEIPFSPLPTHSATGWLRWEN